MKNDIAIFAMGCFWCTEAAFRDFNSHALLPGILSLRVGYAGGLIPNPSYEYHPGYKEALKIIFDPQKITYESLLTIFWHNIDPLDPKGQFSDKGPAYVSAIFYTNEQQHQAALESHQQVKAKLKDNFTLIEPYTTFYDAEEYHQDYKAKNPISYCQYSNGNGRAQRLKALWGEDVTKK